jgi:hypothetical protein
MTDRREYTTEEAEAYEAGKHAGWRAAVERAAVAMWQRQDQCHKHARAREAQGCAGDAAFWTFQAAAYASAETSIRALAEEART